MKGAERTEVLIVGGGPAGLATAIAARERGLEAHVIDGRRPPVDKACGEGVMPDGVAWLERRGVRLPAGEAARLRGIRYLDGDAVAEARFKASPGWGVRRPLLHAALIRRAEEAGVRLDWRRPATGLAEGGALTASGTIEARWVAGADGLHSSVRRWAGLAGRARGPRRFGVRRHFALAPWTDLVEVYWADGCEAYVTPVSAGEVGVALLWSDAKARFDRLLGRFPELSRRLAGARAVSRDRGAGPLRQGVRGVVAGRVALVGDAGGYLDAITGEGLALAFHQAEAFAAAAAGGDLRSYARAHRRLVALPFTLMRALLLAERHPWLRRRMVRALARDPDLFQRLLAIHARERPPSSLGVHGALRLVRGLAGNR